jgi:TctA family transporter
MAYYMPEGYNVASQINKHLFNFRPLADHFISININVLFGKMYKILYGYATHIFIALFLINLAVYRKWERHERNWIYASLVVYLGLPILEHILPLMDIANTIKRGLFKLYPSLMMVLANSSLLMKLSTKIYDWENEVVAQPMSKSGISIKSQPVAVKKNKPRK